MAPQATLAETPDIGLPLVHRGKVRDVFDAGGRLLIVASDRVSAFDVVFPNAVPDKGRLLTQISALWFDATKAIIPNHFVSLDLEALPLAATDRARLEGRSTLARRANRIDVECVVRGYLAGSAWKAYEASGEVCGEPLPQGLELNSPLPDPIFTPSTKADTGHDENITYAELCASVGRTLAGRLRDASLALYRFGADVARRAGLILADTKFEFGWIDGELTLIDELLTPDSSRFWPQDAYRIGAPIDSLDKQPIRDYVERLGWDKRPPAPRLPAEVVAQTTARYREVLTRLQDPLRTGT